VSPTKLLQDLKTNVVGKIRAQNKAQLKAMAETFTKRKKRNPKKVKTYFLAKPLRYAR
jgi:hypothetical protein